MRLELPYGTGVMPLDLRDANLGEIVEPRVVPAADSWEPLIAAALETPIGTPALADLLTPGQKVAILIDDGTRTTPVDIILPLLLPVLLEHGIRADDISIVVALGTHREMTASELEKKVGNQIYNDYRIVNINSRHSDEFVFMGESSTGTPAWVNRVVAEADFRVGLGQILPHMDAGFSGGAKIVLPGVCSRATVESFHQKELYLDGNQLGQVESPVRLDLEQFVADCVPLDFIVNVVLTADHAPYQVVAGHFIRAHRIGVKICQSVYGVPVQRKYPIVIANAFPKDMDLWQTTTVMWSGPLMLEQGGTLIMLSFAQDKHSAYPDFPARIGADPELQRKQIEAGELDEPISAIVATLVGRRRSQFNYTLVSSGITAADAEQMGFSYFETLNIALDQALNRHGREAKVGVLTQGSVTFPMLKT